jgi:hypothetical protein
MERQNRKNKTKTAMAVALPVFVACVSVLFFAVAYVVHDCEGEECFVCLQIHRGFETWQRLWGGMTGVFSVASSGVAATALSRLLALAKRHPFEQSTPVSVKIRLND